MLDIEPEACRWCGEPHEGGPEYCHVPARASVPLVMADEIAWSHEAWRDRQEQARRAHHDEADLGSLLREADRRL